MREQVPRQSGPDLPTGVSHTSCSHGGTGCFCAAAVICRERNRDIEASEMQDFERMFIDRKSK